MSSTFCPIPWNFQAIRSNGDLRICCQANISNGQGLLRKSDGTPYNAGRDHLSDSRNSITAKEVRSKMLKGQWSETCVRCKQEEESNLSSRRVYENERWDLTLEQVLPITSSDGEIDLEKSPVVFYDLRFGNLCNLKCRMCGPTDSSAWYEDWTELTGKTSFKDTSGPVQLKKKRGRLYSTAYDWHLEESFWEQIELNLKNVQHIYMAGGEPLLIKRHYDFLQKCVDRNYSKNIILEYNTNCTQLPEKVLELWSHFKSVYIGASIDGYGRNLEYQRYPAKWPQILANLKILNSQPKNILSWLAFTVTAYNVFHMIDFMKWKLTESQLENFNRTRKRPIITPHLAHQPKHLNIRVLPYELKLQLCQNFDNFLSWLDEEQFSQDVKKQGRDIANSIQKYMTSDDYHEEYWPEFCEYTKRLDSMRKQNIFEINPNFRDYFVI